MGLVPHIHFVPDERSVDVGDGTTVLRAAIAAGLPHAHACGGNARCSTCRVLVVDGLEHCGPRNARESAIAGRLQCGPEIRLACQTKVSGDVTVRRLVLDPEDIELTDLRKRTGPRQVGEEQAVAVLFADIRGFTAFAETHLPYDVIHILRRLFRDMGEVVRQHGGTVTTFMGDGFMALFGVDDAERAAEHAVGAGVGILDVADEAESWLQELVGRTLEINVGIHYGEAVVGAIRETASHDVVTAIGDTVNLASRVEAANKITGTRMLVSEATLSQLDDRAEVGGSFRVPLPGKAGDYVLTEVTGWHGPPARAVVPAVPTGRRPRRARRRFFGRR
ncbi:MAG TPA: adenylate/guanylate cyclase domain-containing protein [Acidimicrobiia bacterium]|nr:adenylate/guanylate cyclase domain-containing protein [Acidimicrobiia bacterium]